jgi:phosphatidylethanolamine/phosphatidyl-N-methylethanolamine N-methyltransferase
MSINFIKEVIRHPLKTGAIAPSSPFLAREMLRFWPEGQGKLIVEFGPGTGAVTRAIDRKLIEQSYLGFELNPQFIKQLQKKLPHLDVCHRSASDLTAELLTRGLPKADLIVSGLPWSIFSDQLQNDILKATTKELQHDGTFSTFAYIHALKLKQAKAFSEKLHHHFNDVQISKVIWRNLPPAVIYHCKKAK